MKKNLQKIIATDADFAILILRLTLGIMIIPHGLQKTVGAFDGYGFQDTMVFFTETMNIPWVFALLAIIAESLGGLALVLGAMTRIAAFGVGMVMLVAAMTSHIQNGFLMNWFNNQKGEGVEFHFLAVGMAIALMIKGGGVFSADRALMKN